MLARFWFPDGMQAVLSLPFSRLDMVSERREFHRIVAVNGDDFAKARRARAGMKNEREHSAKLEPGHTLAQHLVVVHDMSGIVASCTCRHHQRDQVFAAWMAITCMRCLAPIVQ